MDKIDLMDSTFITTSPSVLKFLPNKERSFFIPNPSDYSFETLNNFKKSCSVDVFFAVSHGVHRGILKSGKTDDRVIFLKNLQKKTEDVKFDIYGVDKLTDLGRSLFQSYI